MAHSTTTPRAWAQRLCPPAFVAVATLVGFSAIVAGEFVWDDVPFLVDEAGWRGLDAAALRWMLTDTYGHYHPLTWLSFAIDHALWGLDATAFRATNVTLHAVNALLVYALALALFTSAEAPTGSGKESLPLARWAAAGAALAFALHPLRVEAVAWAVERRNLLGTGWFLAAILAYLAAVRTGGTRWWALAVACHAASLLSRAGGVVLPLVLAIVDVYPLARHRTVRWTRLVAEKLPFVALAVPIALVAVSAQHESGAFVSWEDHTARERVGQAMYGLSYYPARTLAPVGLAPFHALPRDIDPVAGRHLAGGVAALAVSAVALAFARRFPGGLAAWAAYLVLIGPLLGWSQVGLHEVACRYAYAAGIPFAIAAGALGLGLARRAGPRGRWWLGAGALSALGALVLAAQPVIGVWHDERALWERACEIDPGCALAHQKLAYALKERGELDLAIEHGRRALELEPVFPGAAINLGVALAEQGRYDEARLSFERGLRDGGRAVERAEARLGLGILALAQGALEGAVEHLDLALALDSSQRAQALPQRDRASAHYHRGEAQRRRAGRPGAPRELYARALEDFRLALALDAGNGRAHLSLGLALLVRGDPADLAGAAMHLERATALRPRMPEAWYGLAKTLALAGKTAEARSALMRASAVAPPAWREQLEAFGRSLEGR